MGIESQQRYGCVIGRDYPEPCVDHDVERQVTMERYRSAKQSNKPLA